jgi:TolB-like protein/Tfp pilus assembly protein PilF
VPGLGYWYVINRAAGNKPIESIAVMPFVNASGNADVEYLSDGMTETLISSLSQLPKLNVKARSSVFRYKGKEFDLPKIAQELKVQAILTGRVVQRGEQLTLSLELVDTQTENAIWSDQYNRKQTDLISLQSEIARDVSQKLRTKLSGADEQKLTKKYTENPEAYKLYLQGNFYANRRSAKDVQKAIESFQQAIAIDPNYALAYAGLANTYTFLFFYGDTPADEAFSKARETVLKALALDNTLAEAHGTLAVILINQDGDSVGSERESKRALELNPNFAEGHRRSGIRLMWAGQYEEALAAYRRALEIDPLSSVINLNYGMCLFYAGRYAESDAQLKQTLSLDANLWLTHYHLFNSYRFKGDHSAAIEALAKSQELRDEPDAAKLIRESFAKGGWPGFLRTMIAERTRAKLSPYMLATCAAELGEKDKAFALLNEAREKGDQFFLFRKIDPLMNPLRADPRFQELLKNVRPPQ